MSVIVKLLSKFDDSGIKKAKHSFSGLKHAIGAIGIGIGVSQVTNLLIDSAKAASADAKSTLLLNTQLEKNAKATKTQIKQADKFVEKLSLQTGILDDDLRPSFGKLARATKDTSKAQDLLKLSLDAATVSGKPLDSVASAMARAFNGNTTSLVKMFPELKKSKDLFGDLKTEVEGAAKQQADPFMKFNNSIDILKEKLGAVVLPLIVDFVTELTKPGGIVDVVGKFFDDMSNPKTDAGKMFTDIQNAAQSAFGYVKDFFALFGNGDAMKGFGNVASALVKALPALIALKGILMLAAAGKSLANLAAAVGLIQAKSVVPATGAPIAGGVGAGGLSVVGAAGVLGLGTAALLYGSSLYQDATVKAASRMGIDWVQANAAGYKDSRIMQTEAGINFLKKKFPYKGPKLARGGIVMPRVGGTQVTIGEAGSAEAVIPLNGKTGFGNTVNIYVQSADPKAVVDAVAKYVKANGKLPSAWGR